MRLWKGAMQPPIPRSGGGARPSALRGGGEKHENKLLVFLKAPLLTHLWGCVARKEFASNRKRTQTYVRIASIDLTMPIALEMRLIEVPPYFKHPLPHLPPLGGRRDQQAAVIVFKATALHRAGLLLSTPGCPRGENRCPAKRAWVVVSWEVFE